MPASARVMLSQRALIHGGGAGGIHRGSSGNQRRRHSLTVLCAGINRDAAGVDTLLLHQIVLRVFSALSSESATTLLGAGSVANQRQLGVGRLLQFEGDVIEASLALVVDAGRTALVALEVNRAEAAGRRSRRRRRRTERHGRRSRSGLALVIHHIAGHGDRS